MFDQLAELIKDDDESKLKFKELLLLYEEMNSIKERKALRRARIQAITLAIASILTITSFTFALIVKIHTMDNVKNLETELVEKHNQLEDCLDESNK